MQAEMPYQLTGVHPCDERRSTPDLTLSLCRFVHGFLVSVKPAPSPTPSAPDAISNLDCESGQFPDACDSAGPYPESTSNLTGSRRIGNHPQHQPAGLQGSWDYRKSTRPGTGVNEWHGSDLFFEYHLPVGRRAVPPRTRYSIEISP